MPAIPKTTKLFCCQWLCHESHAASLNSILEANGFGPDTFKYNRYSTSGNAPPQAYFAEIRLALYELKRLSTVCDAFPKCWIWLSVVPEWDDDVVADQWGDRIKAVYDVAKYKDTAWQTRTAARVTLSRRRKTMAALRQQVTDETGLVLKRIT